MKPSPGRSITGLLLEFSSAGEKRPARCEELLPLVYDELRRMARALMRGERKNHTLQPTALVHEAYLKLVDQSRVEWRDRAHFLGIAVPAMRRILVDHARRHASAKRGGGWQRITLDERIPGESTGEPDYDLLALDRALESLADEDARAGRVAELRLIGGLTVRETAEVIGVSPRTVDNDWTVARLWLARALHAEGEA